MRPRRWLIGAGVVASATGLGLWGWQALRPAVPVAEAPAAACVSVTGQPATGELDRVLAVCAHGGTAPEVELAIETLDFFTRQSKVITINERAALFAALERGAPAALGEGAWAHLFNCACNALAVGQTAPDEPFIALLERIAVDDPSLVMRLYALQHLGVRYDTATAACQQRLRALVQRLLGTPDARTAGTALGLWRRWEKAAGPGGVSSLELSRAIAADPARPIDVRVSALHAMGDDPSVLDLARSIAPDLTQPAILRKAALNLIGRHGQAGDLAVLHQCSLESPRMAQAGKPAASALEGRLAGSSPPVLIPLQ